jgi:choline-glycine betaine transporter
MEGTQVKGTWQTDNHARGGLGLAVAVLAVLWLLSSGAASALTAIGAAVIIAAAAAVVVILVGLAAVVAYRARQNRPGEPLSARLVSRVPPGPLPRLENPYKPAIEQPAPRELHLHFHGADPADVAETLRRINHEE